METGMVVHMGGGKGWWLHKDKQGYMASIRVSGSI